MEYRGYCPFGPESDVQVVGVVDGIRCTIKPDALTSRMPQDPFLSEWRLDPGWAELLMVGHLSFLRSFYDLRVPQDAIEDLVMACAALEVVSIN